MDNKIVRSVVCLLLAAILAVSPLTFCYSAEAAGLEQIIIAAQDLFDTDIVEIIWLTLKAWGIEFQLNDTEGYTPELYNTIMSNILEYLDSVPSPLSWEAFMMPWKFFYNPSGNLVGNRSFLDDIEDLADWLITKFNLAGNSVTPVNPINKINDFVIYQFGEWYPCLSNNGQQHPVYFNIDVQSNQPERRIGYTMAYREDLSSYVLVVFATQSTTISGSVHGMTSDGTDVNTQGFSISNASNFRQGSNYYYCDTQIVPQIIPAGSLPSFTNRTTLRNYFDAARIRQVGDINIITDVIELPSDIPNLDPDADIVITPSGPIYLPVEWPESVTVDNYPTIISKTGIQNPGFAQIFSPIRAMITEFSVGVSLVTSIAYDLPDEVWHIAYAIMAAVILFGALHIMKEH